MTAAQWAELWRKLHTRLLLSCDVAIGVSDYGAAVELATLARRARAKMENALARARTEMAK